ncbi:4312_t:CDS:2 [Paraglomus occultum]|uniref:4312_t:CDS:1 n=1 Tax=Paraglomus occultum TaxID=144539 RepID=A0A9N9EX15_9GLOM|nr:4312_t:CDS:2 [Paraglomus occultum]
MFTHKAIFPNSIVDVPSSASTTCSVPTCVSKSYDHDRNYNKKQKISENASAASRSKSVRKNAAGTKFSVSNNKKSKASDMLAPVSSSAANATIFNFFGKVEEQITKEDMDVDANDVEEKGVMENATLDVHTSKEHNQMNSILIVDNDYDIINVDEFLDNAGTVGNMAHQGNDNVTSKKIPGHNDNIEIDIIYLSDDDYKNDMILDSSDENEDQLYPLFESRLTRLSYNTKQSHMTQCIHESTAATRTSSDPSFLFSSFFSVSTSFTSNQSGTALTVNENESALLTTEFKREPFHASGPATIKQESEQDKRNGRAFCHGVWDFRLGDFELGNFGNLTKTLDGNEIDTTITVDAFKYGQIPNCTAYFLSHFHSDHYGGLSSTWAHGPIYCSTVTGNLVIQKLRVKPEYVHKLPMDTEIPIESDRVTVTLIDANHCPGSVLFLFKLIDQNNKTVRRYLHTGDFRACPKQVLHSAIANLSDPIDVLYLDTTYLNSHYRFPAQEQVVKAVVSLIAKAIKGGGLAPVSKNKVSKKKMVRDPSQTALDNWLKLVNGRKTVKEEKKVIESKDNCDANGMNAQKDEKDGVAFSDSKLLVVVGTYLIGKEKIFMGIAKALGSKIYVSAEKRRILACQENKELDCLLTNDPCEACVHVASMTSIRPDLLVQYLDSLRPRFSTVIGIRPTGWTYKPLFEQPFHTTEVLLNTPPVYSDADIRPAYASSVCQIFGVPYSEHSSFRELAAFIMSLNVKHIVPTVNVGTEKSCKAMNFWLCKWQETKQKNGKVVVVPYPLLTHW